MQRRYSAGGCPVRRVRQARHSPARQRRIILAALLCAIVAAAGTIGYVLGTDSPALAMPLDDGSSVAAFNDQLAKQDELCASVEQINLQEQLDAEKSRNNALADSLDSQQNEIDTLEETILNALMANLSNKMISRSSSNLDTVCKEAKNLVSLSRKLKAFNKTPEAEKVNLASYKQAIDKKLNYLPTLKPIAGSLDGYGWRIHPVYHRRDWHPAVDMGAPAGTKIKSAGAGTVVAASYDSSAGRYVKISHGNGFITLYYHCSVLYVQAGDTVKKGEVIATVGSTGVSTTPHLHFQMEYYGTPFNPRKIIME
jgi:murein DD-endopeptidase MepM/ murein hydrolase activator NlpD